MTCGPGAKTRRRKCYEPVELCVGNDVQADDCYITSCPKKGIFCVYLFFCFTSRATARVILRWVVYGWRIQCILVGQDSAL